MNGNEGSEGRPWINVWIVNFNSSRYLERCLSSLATEPVGQVTVLDNGSSRQERIMAERIASKFENTRFFAADQNLGFGGGMNRIAASYQPAHSDEVVWLLNPDCEVEVGATSKLIEALGSFDIVSPLITSGTVADRTVWFAGGMLEAAKGACSHLGYGRKPEEFVGKPPMASTFLSGASLVMNRSTWDGLGGFREDLFLYWEDAELCLRAMRLKMRLGVVPQAQVWHREGGSSVRDGSLRSKTYYYYIARNRIIVCSAEASKYDIVIFRGLLESLKLLGRPLIRETSGRWGKFWAALRGTVDGIKA